MLHNLICTQLRFNNFVRILALQDRNLENTHYFIDHKFFKLYDNASLLPLRVSHHKFYKLYDNASLLTLRVSHHKFFKLYDNAIFTHCVCHINLHNPPALHAPKDLQS